jgi:hypothetical protein
MDTNNPFFDSYKKKMEEQKTDDHKTSSSETDKQTGLRFEERNGFVKPERTDTRLPVKTPAKKQENNSLYCRFHIAGMCYNRDFPTVKSRN